ncbi:MAG: hypothetical protein KatS3mg006_0314 [Pyrinomonadaceae bacterium]|nr:MAG: hypothetical protein KatS3mg006_0314 [Pyrinomonadaceae bacterium]
MLSLMRNDLLHSHKQLLKNLEIFRDFLRKAPMIFSNFTLAVCNPMVNPLNNRFMDGQGYEYDETGNLTRDAQGRRFIYDGENKQVEVRDASICWKVLL